MISNSTIGEVADTQEAKRERLRRTRRVLGEMRGHLTKRVLRLIGFLAFVYLVLKIIPGLENALKSLEEVSLAWVIGLMAVETLSEMGYVVSWRGILDPEGLLQEDERGKHLGSRVAWAQLGGGMIVPGMAGMLVVFGVDHNDAIAAVVLYQAIGFIVPLIGGGIAYVFLRRQFGSMHEQEIGDPAPAS
jgi:uncharacterized membrane protein YbhN (UPF0104 family)